MAEVERCKNPRLNNSLTQAVDLFVMRKFEDCFKACCSVIKAAKCEPEHERNQEVIEASAALGIQALAETDMWDQAIAFIKDVYSTVDLCPPRIIQVCILLHAHVREYLPCHGLVQIWLCNPQNRSSKQCAQVIRIFSQHILLPTGRHDAVRDLVSNCSSLSDEDRQALLQLPQAGRFRDAEELGSVETVLEPSSIHGNGVIHPALTSSELGQGHGDAVTEEDSQRDNNVTNRPTHPNADHPIEIIFNRVLHQISVRVKLWWPKAGMVLMAVLAVLALIHAQTHDPMSSLGRLVILWKEFFRRIGLIS